MRVPARRAVSERALRAAAMFGLTVADGAPETPAGYADPVKAAQRAAAALHRRLKSRSASPRGLVVLLTGPSGSGKSMIVRALRNLLGPAAIVPECHREGTLPRIVDLFPRPLSDTLRLLARAGLADARLFARRISELSDGERARLAVALGMDRAERARDQAGPRPITLLLDGFAEPLDRPAAAGVASTVRRWAQESPRVHVVAATAHEDVAAWLRPALLVRCGLGEPPVIEEAAWSEAADHIEIRQGSIADYPALARFHYRAAAPATVVRVLVATAGAASHDLTQTHAEPPPPHCACHPSSARGPIGILVVSMPALNGPWRHLAWPGRYNSPDKRTAAARLNAEVRTISRVIVEPRWRGRGIARRLVRAYLDAPLTPRTEAIAAMGDVCPFFQRAGMRRVWVEPSARDRRLLEVLAAARLEPWELLDTRRAADLARSGELRRALRIWANAARGTRRHLETTDDDLRHAAAAKLSAPGIAYVHG